MEARFVPILVAAGSTLRIPANQDSCSNMTSPSDVYIVDLRPPPDLDSGVNDTRSSIWSMLL